MVKIESVKAELAELYRLSISAQYTHDLGRQKSEYSIDEPRQLVLIHARQLTPCTILIRIIIRTCTNTTRHQGADASGGLCITAALL